MTATYDAAFVKREAIRRRQRALGIYAVPPVAVLDRIVAEHEAAAALVGHSLHDELCEATGIAPVEPWCYCTERHDALERIARRFDTASGLLVASNQSVNTEQEEGPR